uniref:Uncharacterized protein n=1 Tax=Ditylenchus dipsaci TaxID=166011 RepID=A0A915DXQ7_9BILA
MKRIFGFFRRKVDDVSFQHRALQKVEKIEKGEKVLPPKHPTDEKAFRKALDNDDLKEKVNAKYDDLVTNMNKIIVTSSDPPPKQKSSRPLPTHADDVLLDQDLLLYGFHEPPLERMDKNKLMFREALEILRTRLELEDEQFALGDDEQSKLRKINSQKFLQNHPAVKRVDRGKLDTIFEYFRPFVRLEEQMVVRKKDAERLNRLLEGDMDDLDDFKVKMPWFSRKLGESVQKDTLVGKKNLATLDAREQTEMLEGDKSKQREDARRLDKALSDLHQDLHSQPSDINPALDDLRKPLDDQPKKEQHK